MPSNSSPKAVASNQNQAFFDWLLSKGCCHQYKIIGDGIYAAIKPLMFHWTMIVGQVGDTFGFEDGWCYENREKAEKALAEWNGEGDPEGWHRHPMTGRRRVSGDATTEYVAW